MPSPPALPGVPLNPPKSGFDSHLVTQSLSTLHWSVCPPDHSDPMLSSSSESSSVTSSESSSLTSSESSSVTSSESSSLTSSEPLPEPSPEPLPESLPEPTPESSSEDPERSRLDPVDRSACSLSCSHVAKSFPLSKQSSNNFIVSNSSPSFE